jgi:homoserine dehydrogenase
MSIQNNGTKLTIGLFGFGVVGASLYEVLTHTPTLNAEIKKVCIRDAAKVRNAPQELFTTCAEDLLGDTSINVIVELTNDPDAALHIITTALQRGKAVVSAGKKTIAEHLPQLIKLQQEYDVPLLYEAACCASIPVIRNLEEYYDNDLLHSISGIVNGSSNYILTRMAAEKLPFAAALQAAQLAGFAETNPALDIEGGDAANKLSILLTHAYGALVHPSLLLYTGITSLQDADTRYAREKGYEVKLIAQARKLHDGSIAAFVLPQFVTADSRLKAVKYEYNGVEIESSLADKQFFYGKGAGGFPTASAVLSDLSALRYNYRYEYRKLLRSGAKLLTADFYLHVCISFRSLLHVRQDAFARIDEWVSNGSRCHISGIIHCSTLLQQDWWRKNDTSLILYPDAILAHFEPPIKRENQFVPVTC